MVNDQAAVLQTVRVTVTKSDLYVRNLAMILMAPSVWKGWALWTVLIGGFIASAKGLPKAPVDWGSLFMATAIGALVSAVLIATLEIWKLLLIVQASDDLLGVHELQLRPEGLFERTSVKETLTPWSKIKSLRKRGRRVVVEILHGKIHTIPQRAFSTQAQFEEFWREISARVRTAG